MSETYAETSTDIVQRLLDRSVAPSNNMNVEAAAEIKRLRKIEAAAMAWRQSLEDDGWTKHAIEEGVCRPGMSDLMRLIQCP